VEICIKIIVMTQQNSSKPTVAIIGLGNIGKVVAKNLVTGGRAVLIADRDPEEAKQLAAQLGGLAQAKTVIEAIAAADIVIPAISFKRILELLTQQAAALQGKIIVDVSNPIAPDGKGGFAKIIGEKESAGQQIAAVLPAKTSLAKAFGTLSAGSLAAAAFRESERAVLFYATDDRSIDATIEALIGDSGFEPVRVGGIDQSIRIEVFGDLHELGALGKPVNVAEARERV
jgi:predicted dinucleotide-binding enzyme